MTENSQLIDSPAMYKDSSSQFSISQAEFFPSNTANASTEESDLQSSDDVSININFNIHEEAHRKFLKRQQEATKESVNSTISNATNSTSDTSSPSNGRLHSFTNRLQSTKIFQLLFPSKLGLLSGVMIPIVLNTFGVILFLRLGQIVGKVGFLYTFLMFAASYLSIGLTILSLSAISTNGKIRGGGAYYMISRVLGPEFGASIGLIFFLANVFGGGLYLLGFVEALKKTFPIVAFGSGDTLVYSSGMLLLLTVIVMLGAALFSKTNLVSIVVLTVSMLAILASLFFQSPGAGGGAYEGWSFQTLYSNLFPSLEPGQSLLSTLQTCFGILYPATTGALAGSDLSSQLANVSRDLPKGTSLATIFTFLIYVGLAFLIACTMNTDALINNTNVMTDISLVPTLMTIGIFSSTIGAALMSIISASRIIQAVSRDKLLPFLSLFGIGFGKGDEPRFAVFLTWFLLQLVLLIGSLNLVAPFVSIFYVLAYLFINTACWALSATEAPNFRPTFKYFNKWTSLAGSVSSVLVMFFIDPLYASITFVIMVILMIFVYLYAPAKNWGSIGRAIMYYQIRKYNLKMDDTNPDHIKYWRFKALVLTSNPRSNYNLLSFMNSLTKHRGGIAICGHVDTRLSIAHATFSEGGR